MEPLFTYSLPGMKFEVYPNRISVKKGTVFAKEETILLRNVVDVTSQATGKIRISTSDGKVHEYPLGLKAKQAHRAIQDALP